MFRVLEIVGLLAPIGGTILLVLYRKRSRPAFALGITACVLGIIASAIGFFGTRISVASAFIADAGVEGVSERLDSWTLIRFCLLVVASVLLVVAALVDRGSAKPVAWLFAGVFLMSAGVGMHFVSADLGGEHERLTVIVGMLIEIAQVGLLGVGFLVLCIAAIAYREGSDGRQDPTQLAARVGTTAWRIYSESRRGPNR
ncbi:MAG: hypothetical protein ACTHZN_00720 [Canibacter sp.]|uniref:hypothetical protein n=1 Tax=Agrococcus casei TaxID=343512 RepID=UPI003F919618